MSTWIASTFKVSGDYLLSNQSNREGMGCVTICDLPDSLLTQILLNLPTKDSVKTSVLSTRWRNLWLSVPGLDLATCEFPLEEVFAKFMDRFMEFNQGLSLQNFKIIYDSYYGFGDRLMELISRVVDRGVQRLDITKYPRYAHAFMCENIYKSKTLVSLKLANVELKNPEFVVSLPCLKIMCLGTICYVKDGALVLEKLISGCPVLEDLELIKPFAILNQEGLPFLCLRSLTLKRCLLKFPIDRANTDFTVEIDAPQLEYLSLSNSKSDGIVVKNLSSLFRIEICNYYSSDDQCDILRPLQREDLRHRDIFCDFLARITSVRHMIIRGCTIEMFYYYSKLGQIPKFNNLYHFQAEFSSSSLCILPALLESCPNLKSISLLDFYDSKELKKIDFTNVPLCLISTLEYVEIKKRMMEDEPKIFKLVNYFLENSAILKKLTLSFLHSSSSIKKHEPESYTKLLTSTKLSPTCQVIIH